MPTTKLPTNWLDGAKKQKYLYIVMRKLIHQNESSKIRFKFFSLVKSTSFEKVGTNFT